LSKHKAVRFAFRFTASVAIFGAAAVILAGLSTFAMRSSRALPLDGAFDDEPQVSNRTIKSNRLSLRPAILAQNEPAGFVLASAPQGLDLERFYETVTSAQPMLPATAYEQAAAAAEPAVTPEPKKPQAVAALPAAPEKPKRQAPPAPPAATNMLDDGAIAGLKTRLRLTDDQMEYWPAVESALRDVARTQLRHTRQMQGSKVDIDVNSPEVQKLIWAATPLLMRLRAEQKSEVRKLARIMGLEQVASQI
jgi:hypothetical protein